MSVLISTDDCVPLERTPRVGDCVNEWAAVDLGGGGDVAHSALELSGKDLGPDGSGDGVAEGGTDVVGGKVETGDDGDV